MKQNKKYNNWRILSISVTIIILLFIINSYFSSKKNQVEKQVELENDFNLCKINDNEIIFGDSCNIVWFFNLKRQDEVQLKKIALKFEGNYSINDGNIQLCRKINEIKLFLEIDCKSKKKKESIQIWEAEIKYKNSSNKCYFINDTKIDCSNIYGDNDIRIRMESHKDYFDSYSSKLHKIDWIQTLDEPFWYLDNSVIC